MHSSCILPVLGRRLRSPYSANMSTPGLCNRPSISQIFLIFFITVLYLWDNYFVISLRSIWRLKHAKGAKSSSCLASLINISGLSLLIRLNMAYMFPDKMESNSSFSPTASSLMCYKASFLKVKSKSTNLVFLIFLSSFINALLLMLTGIFSSFLTELRYSLYRLNNFRL